MCVNGECNSSATIGFLFLQGSSVFSTVFAARCCATDVGWRSKSDALCHRPRQEKNKEPAVVVGHQICSRFILKMHQCESTMAWYVCH